MKKTIVLFIIFFLVGCSSVQDAYPEITEPIMIKQIGEKQLDELFQDQTGYVVFGVPDSEWSSISMTMLNEAAQEVQKEVYYFNIADAREDESDLYHAVYNEIATYLNQSESNTMIYDQLYVPTVVSIQNGSIVDVHVGTVEGHYIVDGVIPPLSSVQETQLKEIYVGILR